jgi:putative restriction endonuclease
MATKLSTPALFQQVLEAIDASGWQCLILDSNKPFRLRLFKDDKSVDVRVYLWNCSHGGGSARAIDEYRVQLTGVVPSVVTGEVTLLLGWHPDYEVFVGFDMKKHVGQASKSPSIQIKESTLQNAHAHAFAIYHRKNAELAIAFRPEFFVEYALNTSSLHQTGKAEYALSLLNRLDALTPLEISAIKDEERKIIVGQIARKYRAADFSKRVLGAYSHRCAACGIQLRLIDAAHIIPVAATTSTDETKNGIALCKIHHAAYDRNLISFDERYKIEVSDSEVANLTVNKLVDGLVAFKKNLRTAILLPYDNRDYPPAEYITEARRVRHWV